MTDELKPVPCGCGGEAEVTFESSSLYYTVHCKKCEIETYLYDSESKAIEAWNRAMRRAKVDVLLDTCDEKGLTPFCPHCGDELEWE